MDPTPIEVEGMRDFLLQGLLLDIGEELMGLQVPACQKASDVGLVDTLEGLRPFLLSGQSDGIGAAPQHRSRIWEASGK